MQNPAAARQEFEEAMQSDGKKHEASDSRVGEQQQQQPQDSAGTGEGASSAYARMKSQSDRKGYRQQPEDHGHDGAHQ